MVMQADKIQRAIDTIQAGVCSRVDIDKSTKVYKVKNVIRIDIKEEDENNG